jgi:hypothetical protein
MYLAPCLALSLVIRRIEVYLSRSDRTVLPSRRFAP